MNSRFTKFVYSFFYILFHLVAGVLAVLFLIGLFVAPVIIADVINNNYIYNSFTR